MATIRNDFVIAAPPDKVWDVVRDFGALHRLVPGFVTNTTLEGDVRTVTFANGMVARETLVSSDDAARRLAYAIVGGRAALYNASVEVHAEGKDKTRFVWTIDVLPNELAEGVRGMAAMGAAAIKKTLER